MWLVVRFLFGRAGKGSGRDREVGGPHGVERREKGGDGFNAYHYPRYDAFLARIRGLRYNIHALCKNVGNDKVINLSYSPNLAEYLTDAH